MTESQEKLALVRALLDAHHLDAIVLGRVANFAWLADGAASYVNTAATFGAATLIVTRDSQYLVTNNIEATRFAAEEPVEGLGFKSLVGPWHAANTEADALLAGKAVGSDGGHPGSVDLTAEIAALRTPRTQSEIARFQALGKSCAAAMDTAIRQVRPGLTEMEIAGLLAAAAYSQGALPIVNLIATDERIFRFRHPLPTGKKLERYAMLVLCGRRQGLVASVTRLVHFGPLSDELRRKQQACAEVDAAFISATRPGVTLGEVFAQAQAAYARTGFADEWQLHHQGGPAAYEPREFVAAPNHSHTVLEGEVYAWNPSITGVKSEDTILVAPSGNEVLTAISGWPMLKVEANGQTWERPAILQVD
ncbi:MAG: M24 family metallopeptidase [Anaerolineae bacterium]|jgi:antitoxin VapB|nr:M24 family metallopeptidase [Anaerolineae bacterium]